MRGFAAVIAEAVLLEKIVHSSVASVEVFAYYLVLGPCSARRVEQLACCLEPPTAAAASDMPSSRLLVVALAIAMTGNCAGTGARADPAAVAYGAPISSLGDQNTLVQVDKHRFA